MKDWEYWYQFSERLPESKQKIKNMDKIDYDFIKPEHYKLFKDNEDSINVLESFLTEDQFKGFLIGNILKYQLRLGKKPGESIERDQNKIKWLQEKLEKYNYER